MKQHSGRNWKCRGDAFRSSGRRFPWLFTSSCLLIFYQCLPLANLHGVWRQELVKSQGNRLPELLKASPLHFQFRPECCFIRWPGFPQAGSPRPQLLWRAPCPRLWEGYLLPPSVPLVPGIVVSLCYCKKIFWPNHVACGILVPESGIEPKPGEVRAQSPKPWTTRDFPAVTSYEVTHHTFI